MSPADAAQALATLQPGQTATVGITKQSGAKATVKLRLDQYPGHTK